MTKAPSARSSPRIPPRTTTRIVYEISSTEASPIKAPSRTPISNYIHTPLSLEPSPPQLASIKRTSPQSTPLEPTPTSKPTLPNTPISTQPTKPSPLEPRLLSFTTPHSSPYLYLKSLEDLPPRPSNPPPLPTFSSVKRMSTQPPFHHLDVDINIQPPVAYLPSSPPPSNGPFWVMRRYLNHLYQTMIHFLPHILLHQHSWYIHNIST
ncbi:hypothetical protein CTI12_AA121730 [Artemisia annua]|uniref:Uncharacterized protein n=1 Tax=Artemisia annua TaxID=35608 RepID=A0A2U1PRP4_ARTAN|nr:hypothetical protein CTI12_AA121730 [Artemisia annua]